jgi:hypothetical protein
MTDKGAMSNTKSIKLSDSEEKATNSQSKNTKIEDFFGFSGKKRQRDADVADLKDSKRRGKF